MRQFRDRASTPTLLVAFAVCALASFGPSATAARAQAQPPASEQTPVMHPELGEFAPGLWVFLDPQTGLITNSPSPEQVAALRDQLKSLINDSSVGLVPKFHADGSKSLYLQGRYMSASILTIKPTGEQVLSCTDSTEGAVEALTAKKAIPMLDGLETE